MPETDELMRQAYEDHRQIFNQEMEMKKQRLAGNEDPWLAGEIEELKQKYLARLTRD